MKPFFQKLVPLPEQSIIFFEEEKPHFTVPWHYHPEVEILFVAKSTGTYYVGDSINKFTEGEISIIGENMPHWWKSDQIYLEGKPSLKIKALVVQFKKEIFDSNFINLPEMVQIKDLFERAKRGIQFLGNSREYLGSRIAEIFKMTGLKRITELIILLDEMAKAGEYKYLASVGYSKTVDYDFYRFNKINEYIMRNFANPIKLEEIAEEVNMCPTSFCRYFKKRTGKTFLAFLTEYKIGHACKLLVEGNMQVSSVCIESGFNNLSHFNEQFKKIVRLTPTEYQAAYSGRK
jgi:AraC-like DNA-binding protein